MLIYDFLSSDISHINFNKEEMEIINLINKYKSESVSTSDIKYLIYNCYLYNKLVVLNFIRTEFEFLFNKVHKEDTGINVVLNFNY